MLQTVYKAFVVQASRLSNFLLSEAYEVKTSWFTLKAIFSNRVDVSIFCFARLWDLLIVDIDIIIV